MRCLSLLLLLVLTLGLVVPVQADEASVLPQVGQPAPAFRLQDQNGKWHTPADHRGRWVVLYFYPKDFTPGCTTEVCTFRDDVAKLRQAGADVLGVSLDDVKSHADFAAKYHVPFPLLSDADSTTAQAYGVLASKIGFKYARRTTFLIDPNGKVAKVYQDVDPEKNSGQVLADLASLKASS